MQFELPFRDEQTLVRELEACTGLGLQVTLTDNTSTVLSVKRAPCGKRAHIRVHHMFAAADARVIRALGEWIKKRRSAQAAAVLDAFIDGHRHLIRPKTKRGPSLRTRGRVYDLRELYDEVNAAEFGGSIRTPITWGRRPTSRRQRSIRFGSYSVQEDLIRIHPYLDQAMVPRYFIRFVVFHEMLHAHLGIEETETGRRRIHTPEFNRIEQTHPDYARVMAWEKKPGTIRALLREGARCTGTG